MMFFASTGFLGMGDLLCERREFQGLRGVGVLLGDRGKDTDKALSTY